MIREFFALPAQTLSSTTTSISADRNDVVSGSEAALVIKLGKRYFDGCSLQCISTTSLAVKVYVSYDQGTTFEPAVSVDAAGSMTAADSAVTPSVGDTISWNCQGATHVRVSRTAGSGTATFVAWCGSPPVTTVVGMGTVAGAVKAEDAAHASGDNGIPALTVRQDTAAALAGTDADYQPLITDNLGRLHTTNVAMDATVGVEKVEQRFATSGALTSDTTVKSGVGFLHTITISQNDAAPTAGTIDVYDGTSATGTKLFTWTLTTAVFTPFTVTLDVAFAIGCYVDFTTTADVAVFVSYR